MIEIWMESCRFKQTNRVYLILSSCKHATFINSKTGVYRGIHFFLFLL